MSEADKPIYTEFHPRWYRPRMSTYWWLKKRSYLAFIAREVSSLFVAWFVVYLLLLLEAVARSKDGYDEFLAWSRHPLVILLNVVSLFFIVIHAATWFNLAPQAVVVRVRGKRVPSSWIIALNYVALALSSALVAWLLLGG